MIIHTYGTGHVYRSPQRLLFALWLLLLPTALLANTGHPVDNGPANTGDPLHHSPLPAGRFTTGPSIASPSTTGPSTTGPLAGDELPDQEYHISIVCRDQPLKWILSQLERQSGLSFVYSNDDLDVNRKYSVAVKKNEAQRRLIQDILPAETEI